MVKQVTTPTPPVPGAEVSAPVVKTEKVETDKVETDKKPEPITKALDPSKKVVRATGRIKVKATSKGYFKGDRIEEDEIFYLEKEEEFSKMWMERITD